MRKVLYSLWRAFELFEVIAREPDIGCDCPDSDAEDPACEIVFGVIESSEREPEGRLRLLEGIRDVVETWAFSPSSMSISISS